LDWLLEYTRHSPPGNRPAHWPLAGRAVIVEATVAVVAVLEGKEITRVRRQEVVPSVPTA
jgi:hypothetical protein